MTYLPANGTTSGVVLTHYQWLDLLRWLAAIVVVLTHARHSVFQDYAALSVESRNLLVALFFSLTRLGHEAVIVFFVLSGYLVGGKGFERILAGSFSPYLYAVDRMTRIWIPLLPALLLSAFLATEPARLDVWIGNMVGLQGIFVPVFGGNGPLWSLAYEVWFYLLIYACGRLTSNPSMDIPALVLLVLISLIFTKLRVQYLACWLIGALFYIRPHSLSNFSGLMLAMVVGLSSIVALQFASGGSMQLDDRLALFYPAFEIALAVGTGIACVTFVRLKPRRVLGVVAPLAAFSYTLYLTHFPVLVYFSTNLWTRASSVSLVSLGVFFLAVSGCLFVGWLAYLPFERNTARARRLLRPMSADNSTLSSL